MLTSKHFKLSPRILLFTVILMAGCHHEIPVKSLGLGPERAEIVGTVTKVKDGDTVTVLSNNRRFDIRLYGIDAPEKKQPFGLKAKEKLTNMVLNKHLRVELTGGATFGRLVGTVWVDDTDINLYMVCQGLAWWAEEFAPRALEMETCQETAKQKALGLWSVPNPVPPWVFRKQNR